MFATNCALWPAFRYEAFVDYAFLLLTQPLFDIPCIQSKREIPSEWVITLPRTQSPVQATLSQRNPKSRILEQILILTTSLAIKKSSSRSHSRGIIRAVASGGGGGRGAISHLPKPANNSFKTPKLKRKATC